MEQTDLHHLAKNMSVTGSYQCQQRGCQWKQWEGWHCPAPVETKWGFRLTLVDCSGPAPCCCHSSYCTLCNVENRGMVREYDGTRIGLAERSVRRQLVCRFSAEIKNYFLLGRQTDNVETLHFPHHVLLSAICITNMRKSTLGHFKWRTSSSTSWLESHTSWFRVERWLQENSLTKI